MGGGVKDNPGRILSEWISDFDLNTCKDSDVREVRVRILDLLVSAVAGIRVNQRYNRAVIRVYSEWSGKGESTVFFNNKRFPSPIAAYLNATYAHGADLDDGHRTANGHPGVALIPAVLALAEARHKSAKSISEAVLVGYEVFIRLSNVVQPGLLYRGFHGTGVVGAVASSAACAKLLGLDAEKTHVAISLGAVQASGLFEVSESGQMIKPLNPANACRTGIESALLAENGVLAPERPFDGNKGFYKAFSDSASPLMLTDGLGESLGIRSCYIKLSPACRHVHPCIDAGIELGRRRKPCLEEIERIDIFTYPNAFFVTGNIKKPENADEAKFSMCFALAMALQRGRYSFAELESASHMDMDTEKLIDKMRITTDPAYEDRIKGIRGCKVVIHYSDQTTDRCYIPVPKGELPNPLDSEDLQKKMSGCCNGFWGKEVQREIYDCVMAEDLDLNHLMNLISDPNHILTDL